MTGCTGWEDGSYACFGHKPPIATDRYRLVRSENAARLVSVAER